MINNHLSEEEIQQYALDKKSASPVSIQHVSACGLCQSKVAAYGTLFTALQQQQPEGFDYDISALVLERMDQPVQRPVWLSAWMIILSLIVVVLPGIFLYQYRASIGSLFRDLTPLMIPLSATAVCTTIILLSADMYKSYKKKLRLLGLN